MTLTRRSFFISIATTGTMIALPALGQSKLNEKDPQAIGLGYVEDATKTNANKFPKYAAGQLCSNCVLYQPSSNESWGGCPLFAGKQVAGKGWCNAYAKK